MARFPIEYRVFVTDDFITPGYLADFTLPLDTSNVRAMLLNETYRSAQRFFLALTRIVLLLHREMLEKNVALKSSIEADLQIRSSQ